MTILLSWYIMESFQLSPATFMDIALQTLLLTFLASFLHPHCFHSFITFFTFFLFSFLAREREMNKAQSLLWKHLHFDQGDGDWRWQRAWQMLLQWSVQMLWDSQRLPWHLTYSRGNSEHFIFNSFFFRTEGTQSLRHMAMTPTHIWIVNSQIKMILGDRSWQ